MEDLIKQMQQDSGTTAQDNMGKIGAVANDVADTDKEIADLRQFRRGVFAKQKIEKGDIIGYSGNTGTSSGALQNDKCAH